jgi:hypothetical protein
MEGWRNVIVEPSMSARKEGYGYLLLVLCVVLAMAAGRGSGIKRRAWSLLFCSSLNLLSAPSRVPSSSAEPAPRSAPQERHNVSEDKSDSLFRENKERKMITAPQ